MTPSRPPSPPPHAQRNVYLVASAYPKKAGRVSYHWLIAADPEDTTAIADDMAGWIFAPTFMRHTLEREVRRFNVVKHDLKHEAEAVAGVLPVNHKIWPLDFTDEHGGWEPCHRCGLVVAGRCPRESGCGCREGVWLRDGIVMTWRRGSGQCTTFI